MSLKQLLKSLKRKKRTFRTRSRTFVYLIEEKNAVLKPNQKKALKVDEVKLLSDYMKTLTAEERGTLKSPKYFTK
jgi:hypothetical protein